jgi:hypothetical protein
MTPASEPAAAAEDRELAVRTARKEGRQVVTLRSVERGAECVVECEVYPVTGLRVDPLRPGPYRFESTHAASRFVDEALQALTYLGCDVS